MSEIGVVAIGRNEGERLRRCLASLAGRGLTVVYVDSGSTDGSAGVAESMGAEVVALDMGAPFTAARARNAGLERLLRVAPGVRYVQFLDGDCELADGWLARASAALDARPGAAVAFGLRREAFPDRSVYNRVADIEWNVPIGRTSGAGEDDGVEVAESCGGDALMRVEAVLGVGGYDPTVPVCEEPELCQRLRTKGWAVLRLDAPMTRHDADLLRFRQWARRVCRTGYGGLDFTARFGQGRGAENPFRKQVRSARVWGLGWPLALAAGAAAASALGGPTAGWSAAALLLAALPAQAARVAWKNRDRAGSARAALAYGALTVLSKWVQLYGQGLYYRDRLAGRHARLIEYKRPATDRAGRRVPVRGGTGS
jgi:glycosyltransferase involved in cell wall biosynthesis